MSAFALDLSDLPDPEDAALILQDAEDDASAPPTMVDEDGHKRFVVTTQEQANWPVRKLAQRRADNAARHREYEALRAPLDEWMREMRDIYDAKVAPLDEWIEDQDRELADAEAFFGGMATAYHRQLLDQNPKAPRTIKLPSGGRLEARDGRLSVVVTNEEAAIRWAKSRVGSLVRVKEEIDKQEVAKLLVAVRESVDPETGAITAAHFKLGKEVVAGVTPLFPPTKFSVITPKAGE